jgi:hypothetical protein
MRSIRIALAAIALTVSLSVTALTPAWASTRAR